MPRPKKAPVHHYTYKSYDVADWEGGIGVIVVDTEYGRVIAIPRLNLSAPLLGYHDHASVKQMFTSNKYMRMYPSDMEQLQEMILNDL